MNRAASNVKRSTQRGLQRSHDGGKTNFRGGGELELSMQSRPVLRAFRIIPGTLSSRPIAPRPRIGIEFRRSPFVAA
jgi:hypothetical protein